MAYVKGQPFIPQFTDPSTGLLMSLGTVEFYLTGTSTPTNYYTDSSGTVGGTSLTLNSGGKPATDIYFDTGVTYKLVVKNAAGTTLDTLDPFVPYSNSDSAKTFATVAAAVAATNLSDGDVLIIKERANTAWDVSSSGSADGYSVISLTGSSLFATLRVNGVANIEAFGAVGDDSTDNTDALGAFLDYLIANSCAGYIPTGTFLSDYITKSATSVKLFGEGTIKATGSNKLNLWRFTGVTGKAEISGVTFDANNIAARPLEFQNLSATSSTLGEVYISPTVRLINARNNTPDTYTATGLRVHGGFESVTFEGEIDGVDSTSTTGAASIGLWSSWTGSGDDWVRDTVITSAARIKNVKNSNTVTADADGLQATAPTDKYGSLSVSPGALFEDCEGRAIKSQVVQNSIIAPVIKRAAYDGLTEINLQYAGGVVRDAQVFHDGTYVSGAVVSVSQRPTPDVTECTIAGNRLVVTGTPSSNTNAMVSTDVTDASVQTQGIVIRDNKVKGTVEYMTTHRVANVVDVNRVVIDGNWADTINTAYLSTTLYGSARAQLSVVFTNNGAENSCTGASITNDLIVEYARNNHNISRLITNPYTSVISSGAITVYGAVHRVDTEGSAASDDLDTITGNRTYESEEYLQLYANNDARTVVLKDGTGNLRLNGDFSMNNTEDRIVLSYDGTNWCEISRSDNGA